MMGCDRLFGNPVRYNLITFLGYYCLSVCLFGGYCLLYEQFPVESRTPLDHDQIAIYLHKTDVPVWTSKEKCRQRKGALLLPE